MKPKKIRYRNQDVPDRMWNSASVYQQLRVAAANYLQSPSMLEDPAEMEKFADLQLQRSIPPMVRKTVRPKITDDYRGIHVENYVSKEERRKQWKHKIFLFRPIIDGKESENKYDKKMINRLYQVVDVYDHTMVDFEFNAITIIKHLKKYYGDIANSLYTVAQPISFRVYPEQKEPFILPLFKFLCNYTMLILLVELEIPMENWKPWVPEHWSASAWEQQMNKYIKIARPYANMRKICECVSLSKYLMNLYVGKAGDRIGLTLSEWDFIQVMLRDRDAYESITCTYPEAFKSMTPDQREKNSMDRTYQLLDTISKQQDLPLSVYTRNKLFNPMQFKEYAVHMTHKPTLDGMTIPYTYPTNVIMGIKDIRAFVVDASGGRKAEIIKLDVSDAGKLERALTMMMSPIRRVDLNYECDSKHFRKRYIAGIRDLAKLEGRVFTKDPKKANKFYILDPDKMTDLVGTTIYLKTPITCTHPWRKYGYICSACYGKLMASLNCDIHIGRAAATESADNIEQNMLSAKHSLNTQTIKVEFDDIFHEYFSIGDGTISLNAAMLDASLNPEETGFNHLHLEFYPNQMRKLQDGESRHYDREFDEIVIYNDQDETRTVITEKNNSPLYISPEFNDEFFLPAIMHHNAKEAVRIPFTELVDTGEAAVFSLFEFRYQNNELAGPLKKLEDIMFNCEAIASFSSYDDCIDTLNPLFIKGGIHIPDYQIEMLVSRLIVDEDGNEVDWNDPNPSYGFISINKSITDGPRPLTSVLYRESSSQIGGAHGTYDKEAYDPYAYFIME